MKLVRHAKNKDDCVSLCPTFNFSGYKLEEHVDYPEDDCECKPGAEEKCVDILCPRK